MITRNILTADEMVEFGAELASLASSPALIFLEGQLGAGKTTLMRGFLQALGHVGHVKSPTYTIVEPYALSAVSVYHFDLYRLGSFEELEAMGIDDYFAEPAIWVMEWPEIAQNVLPQPDIYCKIDLLPEGRLVTCQLKMQSE